MDHRTSTSSRHAGCPGRSASASVNSCQDLLPPSATTLSRSSSVGSLLFSWWGIYVTAAFLMLSLPEGVPLAIAISSAGFLLAFHACRSSQFDIPWPLDVEDLRRAAVRRWHWPTLRHTRYCSYRISRNWDICNIQLVSYCDHPNGRVNLLRTQTSSKSNNLKRRTEAFSLQVIFFFFF